jgi:serine protease AprX
MAIAPAVLRKIQRDPIALRNIIIEIDPGALEPGNAFHKLQGLVQTAIKNKGDRSEQNLSEPTVASDFTTVHARLQGVVITELMALDTEGLIRDILPDIHEGRLFNPDNLLRSVISIPMLHQIEADEAQVQSVMIEVNFNFPLGRPAAQSRIAELVAQAIVDKGDSGIDQRINNWKSATSQQYVYARLQGKVIRRMAELDATPTPGAAIYHIWPDFKIRAQIWKSNSTVKADASRRAFATSGRNIVWAILDSGVDGRHPHFKKYDTLVLPGGLKHMDFTGDDLKEIVDPADLTDDYGHGTHVAGIIAGELDTKYGVPKSLSREKDPNGKITYRLDDIAEPIAGVAPECKILSFKVLGPAGDGDVSTVIAAIQKIQEINGYGRQIVVHGVNMSLGYAFDPEWFACGQSPICVEVDRLVRSGVAVVVAAGNTGQGAALSINDPGNADLAITVGATHRDMPHRYGVSYFSSKGPTGDGRPKPDLLAPGERIVSCGAGPDLDTYLRKSGGPAPDTVADAPQSAYYLERSGTSMAAPHVSGIIAGILSVRTEFIGLPEELKKILVNNATDLGRDRSFQGGGLVDMMRSIQAV